MDRLVIILLRLKYEPKKLFGLLLFTITIHQAKAVLTSDGIVSADSTYTSCDDGYCSCLYGLNDGKFIGNPGIVKNKPNKCCAHNNCSNNGWMNIKLSNSASIDTVLLINRETSWCDLRIKGLDLAVGINSLPI